jgi:hypothetical protein
MDWNVWKGLVYKPFPPGFNVGGGGTLGGNESGKECRDSSAQGGLGCGMEVD